MRHPRIDVAGITQHLIQRGVDRSVCFIDDEDRRFYLSILREVAKQNDCQVHAYVLMSNHVHMLVTGGQLGCISTMMQGLGRRYVQYFNSRYHRTGTLWEGRFKSSLVDQYLRAGMARVDNVFQMSRRAFNALERPLGTSSAQNMVWHGYQPYNSAMVEKYLCIFRVVNNFIVVGTDGKTPAMSLGFAQRSCSFEDILWDGERVPQPKRVRRKGKSTLKLTRVAA